MTSVQLPKCKSVEADLIGGCADRLELGLAVRQTCLASVSTTQFNYQMQSWTYGSSSHDVTCIYITLSLQRH